jgi:hypothetical protein
MSGVPSSAPGRGKALTRGSSSRHPSRPSPRGRWPATRSPRRCPAATSSAWSPTTGCSRIRTRSPAGGSAIRSPCPSSMSPRQAGDTVFVDDRLVPYPDQWAFSSPSHASIPTPSSDSPGTRREPARCWACGGPTATPKTTKPPPGPAPRHGEDAPRASRGRFREPSDPCCARGSDEPRWEDPGQRFLLAPGQGR